MDNIAKMNKQEKIIETTTANINGLRIMTCQGCHKSMFEDKFMLNKTQKRYRSCINCVLRSRATRLKGAPIRNDNNIILAIGDDETNNINLAKKKTNDIEQIYNIEPNAEAIKNTLKTTTI